MVFELETERSAVIKLRNASPPDCVTRDEPGVTVEVRSEHRS